MVAFDLIASLLYLNAAISCVMCHSWITCTDYVTKNDDVYDVKKCRGFPRAANSRLPKTKRFGVDSGFDTRPGERNPCQTARNDDAHYDRDHPIAVYYPGQQVVLAHPMKNHGADVCTNIYIPDNGNFIYRSRQNARSDPPLSEFRRNLVFDLGRSPVGQSNTKPSSYPKPGFQNAPAFCDKSKSTTDNALGTYSFNVPRNLKEGRYTFIWLWAFNGAQDLYSTCFEVDIVRNLRERNQRLLDNGFSDTSEPCGGDTSNPSVIGNCNQPLTGTSIPPQMTPRRPGIAQTPARPGPQRTPSVQMTPRRPGVRQTSALPGPQRTRQMWANDWDRRPAIVCDCRCNSSSEIKAGMISILIALIQYYITNF